MSKLVAIIILSLIFKGVYDKLITPIRSNIYVLIYVIIS